MVNKWMQHVKDVRAGNPGKSLKDILKMAAKTYKRSPKTEEKKKKKHRTRKVHHKKRHHRRHRRGKRKHRGGGEDAADGAPVSDAKVDGGNTDTMTEGSTCTLPARDGSMSVTGSDKAQCAGSQKGGKTKKKHRKRRKRRRRKRKGGSRKTRR